MTLKQNPLAIKPGDIVHREKPLTNPPTERTFSKEQMNRMINSNKRHYMALREIIELTKADSYNNINNLIGVRGHNSGVRMIDIH